jgi:hypothetical protein
LAIPVNNNAGIATFVKYKCVFLLWAGLKISIKPLLRRTLQLLLYIQQAGKFHGKLCPCNGQSAKKNSNQMKINQKQPNEKDHEKQV